jgi:two-component system alkaline phosphatase synthesis response regulator PhoP
MTTPPEQAGSARDAANTVTKRVVLIAPHTPSWEDIVDSLQLPATTYEWLPLTTPAAAVAEALQGGSVVLIADLQPDPLRGMTTVSVCRQIAPLVPVVVVAANPSVDFARRIRSAGVFYLALAPVTTDEMRSVLSSAFECFGRKRADTSTCVARRRILLVDDDADFRASMAALLESRGYIVSVARNGREALEKVRAEPPDLLVLDVMMEYDSSGYEVTQAIKFSPALECFRDIPILMVSSIPIDPATRFSMAGEVDMVTPSRYLTKPVDIPSFLASVKELLGEKPEAVMV